MLQVLFKQNIFVYIMLGVCVVDFISRIILNFSYKGMIKSAENMGGTEREFLKGIRNKFEGCYKMNVKVNNVEAFVNKYLLRYKICGLPLKIWERMNVQAMLVCLLLGSIGALYGMFNNFSQDEMICTFLFGIATGLILLFIEISNKMENKKNTLLVYIQDYLENFLQNRLEKNVEQSIVEEKSKEVIKRAEKKAENKVENKVENKAENKVAMEDLEYLKACISEMAIAQQNNNSVKENKESKENKENKVSSKEEKMLEEMLKEFFSQS